MNPVEWLIYAAALAYRSDPDHWLMSAEPMCAALDVIHAGDVKRADADGLKDFAEFTASFARLAAVFGRLAS